MAIPLNINGAVFEYPENFDEQWGVNATGWAQAVTNGTLQKAGGNFPLTADVNFGASFGLASAYYKSRASNVASAGVVRLAVTDNIAWRNNANSANLLLGIDGSDNLTFNGSSLSFTGAVNPGTAGQLTYYAFTGNAVSPTPFLTYTAPALILQPAAPGVSELDIVAPGSNFAVLKLEGNSLSNAILSDNSGNLLVRDVDNNRAILTYTRSIPQISTSMPLAMGSNKITGLAAPTTAADALAYGQGFDVGNHKITGVATPTTSGDALSYGQGFDTGSHKITGLSAGTTSGDALAYGQALNGSSISISGLNNNRIIVSSGGAYVEEAALTAFRDVATDTNGLPVAKAAAVQSTTTSTASVTSSIFTDTNLNATITPSSTSARVKISISGTMRNMAATTARAFLTIKRGSTNLGGANGFAELQTHDFTTDLIVPVSVTYIDSPATIVAQNYVVALRNSDNSTTVTFPEDVTAVMTLEDIY